MIKISGSQIPTPSTYQVGILDISKAERNARGTMIIERIATKRKIEFSYNYLSQADCSSLLQKLAPVSFSVQYIDPQTGGVKTGTFYSGDRNCEGMSYENGIMKWKNIKFSLIEL